MVAGRCAARHEECRPPVLTHGPAVWLFLGLRSSRPCLAAALVSLNLAIFQRDIPMAGSSGAATFVVLNLRWISYSFIDQYSTHLTRQLYG
jgi:hypothetical protein